MWRFIFLLKVIFNIKYYVCKVVPYIVVWAVYSEVDHKTKTLRFKIILFVMSCHIILCSNRMKHISNNGLTNFLILFQTTKVLKWHYSVTIVIGFVLDNNIPNYWYNDYDQIKLTYSFR